MYLWVSRWWNFVTRIAMWRINMTIGRGVQTIHIHVSVIYNPSKAVQGFAHLAHGTYHCNVYSKYGSVQSARDMNLSLTVKPPTEISVSADTVWSVKSASISNCDLSVETRTLYYIDKFNFPKMHLRIFNSIPLYFTSLPWGSLTVIGGRTSVAAFTVQHIEFPNILLWNKFVYFRNPLLFPTSHLSMTSTPLTLTHLLLARNG
jgi:hypothetical protein